MSSTVFLASVLLTAATVSAEARVVVDTKDGVDYVRHLVIDGEGVVTHARAQSRIIYLNRHGVMLTPGPSDARNNRSSLITRGSSIPPWAASPELWAETVGCLRDLFAPFDVRLTESDPGNIPHIEAVFGGSSSLLGLPRAGGVAPFSTSCKVVENAIVFAFTDTLPSDAKVICEAMAQEIAHSFGVDHELLEADPMTYLSYAGKRSFQDTDAECGELTARACGAPGYPSCRARQNSYRLLLERLGPAPVDDDHAPPDMSDPSDADGEELGNGCAAGGGCSSLLSCLGLAAIRRRRRVTARPIV